MDAATALGVQGVAASLPQAFAGACPNPTPLQRPAARAQRQRLQRPPWSSPFKPTDALGESHASTLRTPHPPRTSLSFRFPICQVLAMSIALRAAFASVVIGLLASRLGAQGVIDGVVTDTSLVPIAGASVTVVGSRVGARTDAAGHFRLRELVAGRHVLIIQRLGYVAASEILDVVAGDTTRPSILLAPVVHTLGPVSVEAPAMSMKMQEFDLRRKAGEGQFMTQEEIRARNSVTIIDLLRTFKGVALGSDGRPVNRRSPDIMGRVCTFQYYVDGVPFPLARGSIDLPPPNDLAGIEVYQNSATIPLRYKSTNGAAFCGVILLWTRDGST